MVVLKDTVVFGHLAKQLSLILSSFIFRNGTNDSISTGERRYSIDLPQGRLRILFSGKHGKQQA